MAQIPSHEGSVTKDSGEKTKQRRTKSSIPANNYVIIGEGEIAQKTDGFNDR
ncbi:hypothetical protein WN55_05135 [Dufourea novaeangliae]|uniref:Uncharacterized protein n=1 Tax=Dufourea novaeangliae TaxID=178035 RepID=A0A154PNZ7_DUFNO|nr:hypothetical protein WN55_05135 [Dufourea novaeangliae]